MKARKLFVAACLVVAAMAAPSLGAIIPGLFTTGVDEFGQSLPSGADPHYVVLENGNSPAVIMSSIPGSYIPNDLTSKWIWENANGFPTNVTRTFRMDFDLTGFDPITAMISGTWATDNFGTDILINGTPTGNTSAGFGGYSDFSVNTGFIEGINTLDFRVQDVGVISGFRVGTVSGTADVVPEPTSFAALVGLAGVGCIAMRRKRRRGA